MSAKKHLRVQKPSPLAFFDPLLTIIGCSCQLNQTYGFKLLLKKVSHLVFFVFVYLVIY